MLCCGLWGWPSDVQTAGSLCHLGTLSAHGITLVAIPSALPAEGLLIASEWLCSACSGSALPHGVHNQARADKVLTSS